VLRYGFRTFFCWLRAAIGFMTIWGAVLPSVIPAHLWHGPETLSGFVAAAIAGFLLTGRAQLDRRPGDRRIELARARLALAPSRP
jgi:uncharacterized protein involved in response to NO